MENKFYIDDFEKFLKDKVDDFKMYPSRRVWHSIYNNMHPGSRWPSISMCITLICTLFLIGYLNTGTTKRAGNQVAIAPAKETVAPLIADQSNRSTSIDLNTAPAVSKDVKNEISERRSKAVDLFTNTAIANGSNIQSASDNIIIQQPGAGIAQNNPGLNSSTVTETTVATVVSTQSETKAEISTENIGSLNISNDISTFDAENSLTTVLPLQKEIAAVSSLENTVANTTAAIITPGNIIAPANNISAKASSVFQLSETDKSWIENYAMYNRPAPKKWKGKLSAQLYFTPSVVYRELKNAAGKSASSLLTSTLNNRDVSAFVKHTPSFGFETGTALVFDLLKNVRIKGGVQLNYTRYNVHAFNNYHPSLTSLTLNNENGMSYGTYRSSAYANYYGVDDVKLHSQTYQFSIPAGIDLKLASITDNIDWYAGATVQPTFVFSSRAYLLSSDAKNYVPTNEFMNHFNVNTGLETFLSVKTKSGYTWNIGPQFRRQVFTTNNKVYSIQEKLFSYGIKLGISKKL